MQQQSGWLTASEHCPSPNYNERPDPSDISLLVIHNISLPPGDFGTGCIRDFFCNELDCSAHPYFEQLRELRVSAHFLIERCGRLTQFVPLQQRAWHAGVSRFQGRENCNDFSIGIELEGTDEAAYTDAQYSRLATLSRYLMSEYPALSAESICGHSDIAPERKTDPGPGFDWHRYRALL